MIDMKILLGLQVQTKIVNDKIEFNVSHNEHDTHVEVLTPAEFSEIIKHSIYPFTDGYGEEPSNRVYVTGLHGFCIFENSSAQDIDKFTKYVCDSNKFCNPALDVVLMIDIEDCLI